MQQVQFVGFKQQHVVLMLSRCCPKNYLVFAPMEVQSLADMCLAHIQLLLNMIIIIIVGREVFLSLPFREAPPKQGHIVQKRSARSNLDPKV